MKKIKILIFLILMSGGLNLSAQEDELKKIALATINPLNISIDIGEGYNMVELENYGEIKLLHRDLDKMEIKKKGNTFTAGFHMTDKEIIIENLKQKGSNLNFDFKFKNIKAADITFYGTIDFFNEETIPSLEDFSAQKTALIRFVLPVIHDYLTVQSADIKNSCLSGAIKACAGKIQELDVNMLFSGCYFKCS